MFDTSVYDEISGPTVRSLWRNRSPTAAPIDSSSPTLRPRKVAGPGLILVAEADRVREDVDVACDHDARQDADVARGGVVRPRAGGQVHLRAQGQPERRLVLPVEAHVGAEPEVAEGGACGGRDRPGGGGRRVARLGQLERELGAEAEALPEDEADAEVEVELVADDRAGGRPVRVADDDGILRVVGHDAERRPEVGPVIERLVLEPVAPLLARIEAVPQEPRLRRRRAGGERGCERGQGCETEKWQP